MSMEAFNPRQPCVCCICGKSLEKSMFSHKPICSSECFAVDFWDRTLDDTAIIIGGVCYHDGGNRPNSRKDFLLGHGGRVFTIRMNDGRQFVTNNLWYNGVVPEDRGVQDNAVFVRGGSDEQKTAVY